MMRRTLEVENGVGIWKTRSIRNVFGLLLTFLLLKVFSLTQTHAVYIYRLTLLCKLIFPLHFYFLLFLREPQEILIAFVDGTEHRKKWTRSGENEQDLQLWTKLTRFDKFQFSIFLASSILLVLTNCWIWFFYRLTWLLQKTCSKFAFYVVQIRAMFWACCDLFHFFSFCLKLCCNASDFWYKTARLWCEKTVPSVIFNSVGLKI